MTRCAEGAGVVAAGLSQLAATAVQRLAETGRLRRWVLWVGVLLIAAFVGADGYEAWQDYRGTVEQSERTQLALSRAIAEQTTRMIQEIDVVLSDYADWSATAGGMVMDRQAVRERLRTDLMRFPFVHSIAVVDAGGRLFATTQQQAAGNLNLADRTFFKALAQAHDDALYVGSPVLTQRDRYRTFAVSRRIVDRNGDFAGVIVARIAFEYLTAFYSSLSISNGASIHLVRDDGVVLARYPQAGAAIADDAYARQALAGSGPAQEWTRRDAPAGEPQRLVTLRRVHGYAMAVEVAQPMSGVLGPWKQQEMSSAARTLTLAMFAGFLLAALRVVLDRRDRLEQERRRLERELKEVQKAEALGFLAASMAHDFNNVLGAIVGYAEVARTMVDEPQATHSIDRLLAASERARQLVRRVLTFDPHRSVSHVALEVEPIVAEALELIRASQPRSISLHMDDRRHRDHAEGKVLGDATEVHQVVMNLCSNAVRAMPDGGRLEVRLESFEAEHAVRMTLGQVQPGRWLRLSVIDSGVGLAPGQMKSAFEPFYTTRPVGQGTGIGLTVVRNIVSSMGGAIEVDSCPGSGTRMSVYWPLVDVQRAPAADNERRETQKQGRGQAVLIADDEPELVAVAEEMVASLGYEAIGFSDSRAALDAFRRAPERFDAVLADERMPVLRGIALARAVHSIRPDVPILLITGCREIETDSQAQHAGVMEILEKPLRARDLQTALGRAFGAVS